MEDASEEGYGRSKSHEGDHHACGGEFRYRIGPTYRHPSAKIEGPDLVLDFGANKKGW